MADGGGFIDSGRETEHKLTQQLIDALRDLPASFQWNFSMFETCACGLAAHLGMVAYPQEMLHGRNSPLGMSHLDAAAIFCRPGVTYFTTPEEIAHRLMTWLARKKASLALKPERAESLYPRRVCAARTSYSPRHRDLALRQAPECMLSSRRAAEAMLARWDVSLGGRACVSRGSISSPLRDYLWVGVDPAYPDAAPVICQAKVQEPVA